MSIKRFRLVVIILVLIIVITISLIFIKRSSIIDKEFKSSEKVIVIDPGHGGRDPGAIGFSGSYEKDINLEISKKLFEALKSKGYKVILTRDKDEYIDNSLRADLANKKRARVFISIHGNAIKDKVSVKGIQVLYRPHRESTIGDLDSSQLAEIILNFMIEGTGAKNMGTIVRNDLMVLNRTKMPAILIECGFISNENEEKLLLTEDYQKRLVDSIVTGLEHYFSLNPDDELDS
ncbi:MAG: N-acetylmuramoyl-L-alanine amidase family protein [Tissierellaceae bacterium]|jgi:N-acetylmuramoyl-L-alanine amidase